MIFRQSFKVFPRLSTSHHIRYCSNQVRVRFSPNPTGQFHIGGLRTALYNYLFARNHGGKFILRIVDTDIRRFVPGATEKLVKMLTWAGIEIDEGPFQGDYGPYFQSQRGDKYWEHVHTLLENGSAYHCFCTERRLELLRKECLSRGETPKYDNFCRYLTEDEVDERVFNGEASTIRFKLQDSKQPWEDLIHGPCVNNVAEVEGDPIIMKMDQMPTPHFANVIDDHLMEISHVLRGVDWKVSTPKELQMYQALGWTPPKIAHFSILLNSDGGKISKRQSEAQVGHYIRHNYFPGTLINFITSKGGGFTQDDTTGLSVEELVPIFDLQKLDANSSKLDFGKISDLNRVHLRKALSDPSEKQKLIERLRELVQGHLELHASRECDELQKEMLSDGHLQSILDWAVSQITKIEDLIEPNFHFLWTVPLSWDIVKVAKDIACVDIVKNFLHELNDVRGEDFSGEWVEKVMKEYAVRHDAQHDTVVQVVRKAVNGMNDGPSVSDMCAILGKAVVLQKVSYVVDLMERSTSDSK